MKCFYCGQEVEEGTGELWYIPMDRPHFGLIPVHKKTCLNEIREYGYPKYLIENMDRIGEYLSNKKSENNVKRGS